MFVDANIYRPKDVVNSEMASIFQYIDDGSFFANGSMNAEFGLQIHYFGSGLKKRIDFPAFTIIACKCSQFLHLILRLLSYYDQIFCQHLVS